MPALNTAFAANFISKLAFVSFFIFLFISFVTSAFTTAFISAFSFIPSFAFSAAAIPAFSIVFIIKNVFNPGLVALKAFDGENTSSVKIYLIKF